MTSCRCRISLKICVWINVNRNLVNMKQLLPFLDQVDGLHRGRDAHCWAPPAQIPAGVIHAPGSYLG